MKNKKGEIATLLTLGLVILGGVLAIGSSVFLSQQKTTSTRAAGGCGSGNAYSCSHPDVNKTICPTTNLEFACCVKDNYLCEGEPRYRWYGCTGQPCENTKINNVYGHLFGCPVGVNQGNPESCESQLPTPTSPPTETLPRAGCEHTLNARECKILDETWSYIVDKEGKKWCCPPAAPPPAVTNTCEVNHGDNNQYKCLSNIQLNNQGKIDPKATCEKTYGFTGSTYYPAYKCPRITDVCCGKSGTPPPPPVGAQITASACETVKCQDVKQGTTGEFAKRTFTSSNSSLTKFYPDYQKCNLDTDGTNTNVGSTSYEDRIINQVCTQWSQTGGQQIPITFKKEGTCTASGTVISFGGCTYFEKSGQQDCSNSVPVFNSNSCVIYRVCGGTNCRYDCYKDGKNANCKGANDPQIGYDYIHIINSSSNDIVIDKIVVEKMQWGGNPNKDLGGVTLKPGETTWINLNELGGTFACGAMSSNSIKVWLFNPDGSVLTSAQDGCGGGVKILINIK